jgi:hypothetical protein
MRTGRPAHANAPASRAVEDGAATQRSIGRGDDQAA